MKTYFVVSDVHSFYYELTTSLHMKGFNLTDPNHILIICGDAFDRGDHSKQLFDFLKDLDNEHRLIYVRGNHEDLLIDLVDALRKNKYVGSHHISNGTVKTVANITGYNAYDVLNQTLDRNDFETRIDELVNFINSVTVDYFQLGNTVFVHGWVPTTANEQGYMIVHNNWCEGDWKQARWENGMELHHFGICPSDVTTVVCGHWHTSFGWAKYAKECSEWGPDAIFKPYINRFNNSTIIAIDACTAHTQTVNCVVFDENGNLINN